MSKTESSESIVYISPKINSRIMEYAQAATGEISGFGSINTHTNIVDKLFPLMNQVCSAAETEINPDMIKEFVESGQSATANLWWHSHVMMGCFWSTTDNECIEALGQTMVSLLSIVVNKKREYKARFDLFKPIRLTQDIRLVYYYEFPYSEIEKIRTEVKEKVKSPVIPAYVEPFTRVSKYPRMFNEPKKDVHGMSEKELNEFGYKVDRTNGNKVVKMTSQEIIEFWKTRKEQALNGTDTTNDLFGIGGGSEDIPPQSGFSD